MKTYQAVKAEIARLHEKAAELRKAELKSVIAQVKKTIADYGITAADLGMSGAAAKAGVPRKGRRKAVGAKRGTVGVAKYRDPKTGKTWTGRGKPPNWIVGVKNREPFLIDAPSAAPAAAAEAAPAAKPARKVAKKAAKPAARKRAAAKKKAAPAPATGPDGGSTTE